MVSHFATSNIHRVSISDIEYHNLIAEKEVCNVSDINSKYKFEKFVNLLFTPFFSVSFLSVVIIILVYIFFGTWFVSQYSVLFVISFLVVTFIANVIIYLVQMQWSLKYTTNTNNTKYSVTIKATDRIVEGRRLNCGDIIHLKPGEDVPADIRITKCKNLRVTNGPFSNKEIETNFVTYSTDEDVLKSNNMIFKGSKIISGEMTGIIINRAENTILNKLMVEIKKILSTENLTHKFCFTNEYIRLLTKFFVAGLVIIILLNLYLMVYGYREWQQVSISIELLSVLITEAAFVIIMVVLIVGKKRFNNCILSRSDVSASLGKVDIIFIRDISMFCQCQFIISKLWMDGIVIDGEEVITAFEENPIQHSPTWTALTRASVLCNDANLHPGEEDKPLIQRECDPDIECNEIDQSMLLAFNGCESVKKWGGSLSKYKQNNRSIIGPMYDSISNCKLSVHRLNDGDPRLLLVLQGNPIDILNCCSTVLIAGKEENLATKWKEIIMNSYHELTKNSHIVRAFCDHRISPDVLSSDIKEVTHALCDTIPRRDLRFIGMISFTRSLKPSIDLVLTKCMDLGVKLTFLDSSSGICMLPKFMKIDASKIGLVTDSSYDPVLYNNCIISKADDILTNQLINYSRCRSMVSAVVGKDINDVTAMILANIGIVSSTKSTNICKQFSDICIGDDEFLTIVHSIEKSRRLLNTVHSIVTFIQFPKITFLVGYMCFAFLGLPLAFNLTTILALEICLLLPTICLSFNNGRDIDNINRRFSHVYSNKMIDCGLVQQIGMIELIASSFSYFVLMAVNGFWPRELMNKRNQWYARSVHDLSDSYGQEWTYEQRRQLDSSVAAIVLFTLVILQLTAAVTGTSSSTVFTKKLPNLKFIASCIFSLILTFLILYVGSLFQFMDLATLRISIYLVVLPSFLYLICFTEIRKYLYKHFNESQWL